MSHPIPRGQNARDSANKSASLAIPGVAKHNWMVIANNMPDHSIRSCGHNTPYLDLNSAAERNKRTNALAVFARRTNNTLFRNYFPTANIPADLPTDPRDLGLVWIENACQLAEKTQGNVQEAHRHITEAVRLRSGDPNGVMVGKDFLAARELAIKDEGFIAGEIKGTRDGYAEGLIAGKAEGRKEALQEKDKTEDDAIDLTDN